MLQAVRETDTNNQGTGQSGLKSSMQQMTLSGDALQQPYLNQAYLGKTGKLVLYSVNTDLEIWNTLNIDAGVTLKVDLNMLI